MKLTAGQVPFGIKVLKGFMICININWGAEQVSSSLLECSYNGKQLLFMYWVVFLCPF
jgi:hypothetical protein